MAPSRGDIWFADLSPARGHEQDGVRPVLVVSVDDLNHGPAGLVMTVPLTTRSKPFSSRIPILPPEGGLRSTSFALCEQLRSISRERLSRRVGRVSEDTMGRVMIPIRFFLGS